MANFKKTLKENLTQTDLFARLIRLETKLDLMDSTNKKTRFKFVAISIFIISIELINLALNYMINQEHAHLVELLK